MSLWRSTNWLRHDLLGSLSKIRFFSIIETRRIKHGNLLYENRNNYEYNFYLVSRLTIKRKWHCIACEHENTSIAVTCAACGTIVPKNESWICKDCSSLNVKTNMICRVCNAHKLTTTSYKYETIKHENTHTNRYGIDANHYLCSKCNFCNSVRRKECIACGEPRSKNTFVPTSLDSVEYELDETIYQATPELCVIGARYGVSDLAIYMKNSLALGKSLVGLCHQCFQPKDPHTKVCLLCGCDNIAREMRPSVFHDRLYYCLRCGSRIMKEYSICEFCEKNDYQLKGDKN